MSQRDRSSSHVGCFRANRQRRPQALTVRSLQRFWRLFRALLPPPPPGRWRSALGIASGGCVFAADCLHVCLVKRLSRARCVYRRHTMNILPHKSWHVRNKKNIERVRRDEANARKEEEEAERRRQVAESEARIGFLRKRARSKRGHADEDPEEVRPSSSNVEDTAVNSAAEAKLKRDREQTEKRKQEEWEKKVGILTYLGQGLTGSDVKSPWYLQNHQKRLKVAPEISSSSISLRGDPLFEMQRVQRLMKQSKSNPTSTSMPRKS